MDCRAMQRCLEMSMTAQYASAVESIRRPILNESLGDIDYRELVRLATLAASSHNTQPWKFLVEEGCIRIFPDYERRCPVVDPDDAHLFKSLGCAAENLVHAAPAQGLDSEVRFDEVNDCVVVSLRPGAGFGGSDLSRAIAERQCTRVRFDGKSLSPDDLNRLERAAEGNGVRAITLTSVQEKEDIIGFVNKGNTAQLSNRSFRTELKKWARCNPKESLKSGDGLAGVTAGKPSIPTWLARFVLDWVITAKSQCKVDSANIRSSAGIAVFVSADDSKPAWIEIGRCFERFALQATALEVRTAFINQPIEVLQFRSSFQDWLGLENEHAQLMVRFGRGPQMPFSVRRPLGDVIVSAPPATSVIPE